MIREGDVVTGVLVSCFDRFELLSKSQCHTA